MGRLWDDFLQRIQEVYPDLSVRSVEVVAGYGQNNNVLIVNGDIIFRFPRYQPAIERLERQTWILDSVRSRVNLAVPDFAYRCFEPKQPGKVFIGYARLPGEPLWQSTFNAIPREPARQAVADQLGAFLRQLHSIPVAELLAAEVATFDPLAMWHDLYRRIEHRLFPYMRPDARRSVADLFERFLGEPRQREIRPALVHGDLGGSNILFDSRANLEQFA